MSFNEFIIHSQLLNAGVAFIVCSIVLMFASVFIGIDLLAKSMPYALKIFGYGIFVFFYYSKIGFDTKVEFLTLFAILLAVIELISNLLELVIVVFVSPFVEIKRNLRTLYR